jgi:hypothetical protein
VVDAGLCHIKGAALHLNFGCKVGFIVEVGRFNFAIVNLKTHLWIVLSIFSTSGTYTFLSFCPQSTDYVFTNLEQVFARD